MTKGSKFKITDLKIFQRIVLLKVYTLSITKKSFKVWLAYSAIKFIVKMHFKDAKEVTQQKVTLFFFQVLFTKVRHT